MSTALSFHPRKQPGWPPAPKLHHLDGAPVRAAICTAKHFQRARSPDNKRLPVPVSRQLDRRLWCLPGIYCLLWEPDTTDPTDVYVGSAGDMIGRLTTHDKTGWSHAIMLTGHGMGIGGARQVESAIGRVLSHDRAKPRITAAWERHPTPWGADMPWFLFEPLVVLLDLCLRELGVRASIDPAVARL
jgi:hypothetical protein